MSELFDRIAASAERAMKPVLDDMAGQLRTRIGIPVDKSRTPWIRSKPGEPPRKDTGRLQTSTATQTIDANDKVLGSVSVSTPYAKRLNNEMNRPIFGDILADNREALRDALRRGITNPNGD